MLRFRSSSLDIQLSYSIRLLSRVPPPRSSAGLPVRALITVHMAAAVVAATLGSVAIVFEEPHVGLADSYRALVREFVGAGEPLVPFVLAIPADDFGEFLRRLAACARGEGLPPGFVPHSTYWPVNDGEVVAVSNLRHELTDALRREGGNIGYGVRPSARRRGFATVILGRTLEPARQRGLGEALLTCAKTNVGSVRAIQHNGGELTSEEFIPERGEVVQRWRIDLSSGVR